jgi:hypothetical protein
MSSFASFEFVHVVLVSIVVDVQNLGNRYRYRKLPGKNRVGIGKSRQNLPFFLHLATTSATTLSSPIVICN